MATFEATFASSGSDSGLRSDDRVELSTHAGEGESSMGALILKHMSSILQPITTRILDLEDKAHSHSNMLEASEQRAEKMLGRLEGHDHRLAGLGAELARTAEGLQVTNTNLAEATEKHAQLENDHDITRTLAGRTDNHHKSTVASLGDAQRLHETLDSTVRQIQLALSETNIAHLNINDRIADVRNRLEGLNDRHLDAVKSIQDVKKEEDNTRHALKRFTAAFDKQRKEDARSFSQIDDRTRNLEAGLVETQHQVDTAQKAIKVMKVDLIQVKNDLGGLVGVQQQANQHTQQQDSSRARPNDWQGRIVKIEESFNKLSKTATADKNQTMNVVQALSDGITKNATDLARFNSDLEKADHKFKIQDGRLHKLEASSGDLAAQQAKQRENAERAETELRNQIIAQQRDLTARIDGQAHDLSTTNAELHQTNLRLDAANTNLHTLHQDMVAASGTITKLSSGLDLAHEYFQGVSKGFHDTTKRVVNGQDGMLPPKGGGGAGLTKRTLPLI